MKIDPKALGIAAGVTAAFVSAVCAVLVALAPGFAMSVFGNVVHLDVSQLASRVTWGNALGALVFWGVGAGAVSGLGAWLYNRFRGSETSA